jgi:hypothetical protein
MRTNISSSILLGLLALCAFGLGNSTARAAGPTSELFLTTGEHSITGIQGTNVLFNVAQSPATMDQSALAVNGTIRTIAQNTGSLGSEYTLTGTPTGNTYPFPAVLGSDTVFDGTTDGSFNYAWDVDSGVAYKFNLDWSGGTALFTLGTANGDRAGITYDASNNSLWIAGTVGPVANLISDYSMNGTLLSSFTISDSNGGLLALDPLDGTLWLSNRGGSSLTLEQYTRSTAGSFGALESPLDTETYAGLRADTFGGEFQATPEPATWAAGAALTLALCSHFIRRKRA